MRRGFYVMVVLCFFLSNLGCGSSSGDSSSQSVGADIIQKYSFHIEGQPTTISQQLTDADLSLKESLCRQAGYDLTPYKGQNLSFTKYGLIEKYYPVTLMGFGLPLNLWVITKDLVTVCGYVSVRDDSIITPGLFAVNDPNIK